MLKTEKSTSQALTLVAKSSKYLESTAHELIPDLDSSNVLVGWLMLLYGLVIVLILWVLNIVSIFLIKLVVVIYNIATNFIDSFSSIPDNWRRIVLYTDTRAYPEIVPGIEEYRGPSESIKDLRMSEIFSDLVLGEPFIFHDGRLSVFAEIIVSAWSILMAICVYAPAITYRLSLKSTDLVWSPLFWAFRPLKGGESVTHFARAIRDHAKYKISRFFSGVVICLAILKIGFFIAGISAIDKLEIHSLRIVYEYFFMPLSIPAWQLAALVNAALTWWILFRAEDCLHQATGESSVDYEAMTNFFRWTFMLRNALTLYTGLNMLFIAFKVAHLLDFSKIRILLLPWDT